LITVFGNCSLDNLYSKPRSKNTAAVDMLLLKFNVKWSVSFIHWSVGLWRARKPNWLALCRPPFQCAFGLFSE
jgi:hypothetical protein